MRTDTFGQIEIPGVILGIGKEFLQPGMEMLLEFFEGEPISDVSPGVTSVRVATTASSSHSPQHSAWKEAAPENGFATQVPLFIAPGEIVRIDVTTGRYVEPATRGTRVQRIRFTLINHPQRGTNAASKIAFQVRTHIVDRKSHSKSKREAFRK
jgi:hypothetical protein